MGSRNLIRKPETNLMAAIFGEPFGGFRDDDFYNEIDGQTLHEALEEAIKSVSWSKNPPNERYQQIVKMRYGFQDGNNHTLKQVGEVFGVTNERVRQIEHRTLRVIRHPTRSRKLKRFIKEAPNEGNNKNRPR